MNFRIPRQSLCRLPKDHQQNHPDDGKADCHGHEQQLRWNETVADGPVVDIVCHTTLIITN
jgi:hypothetical protein